MKFSFYKKCKAFTLIEMLLVLLIISVLLILMPNKQHMYNQQVVKHK